MWNPTTDLPEPLTFSSRALRVLSVLSLVGAGVCLIAVPAAAFGDSWGYIPALIGGVLSGAVGFALLRAVAYASDAAIIAARATREAELWLGDVRRDVRALKEEREREAA